MFNMLGEYSPSMLKSVHRTQGGRLEDTAANSLAREFAMHLSDVPMAAQMHVCAASLPPDGSELTQAGFHALPSRTVAPPRIVETPVAFECVLHEKLETASRYVFIGQVRWPSSRQGLVDSHAWRVRLQDYLPVGCFVTSFYVTTRDRFAIAGSNEAARRTAVDEI